LLMMMMIMMMTASRVRRGQGNATLIITTAKAKEGHVNTYSLVVLLCCLVCLEVLVAFVGGCFYSE